MISDVVPLKYSTHVHIDTRQAILLVVSVVPGCVWVTVLGSVGPVLDSGTICLCNC